MAPAATVSFDPLGKLVDHSEPDVPARPCTDVTPWPLQAGGTGVPRALGLETAGDALKMAVGMLRLEVHEAHSTLAESWLSYQDAVIGHDMHNGPSREERRGLDGDEDRIAVEEWQQRVASQVQLFFKSGVAKTSGTGGKGKGLQTCPGSREDKPDLSEQAHLAEFMIARISRAVGMLQLPGIRDKQQVVREFTDEMVMRVCKDVKQWLEQLAVLVSLYHVHILDAENNRCRLQELCEKQRVEMEQIRRDSKEVKRQCDAAVAAAKEREAKLRSAQLLDKKFHAEDKVYSVEEMQDMQENWEQTRLNPVLEELQELQIQLDELKHDSRMERQRSLSPRRPRPPSKAEAHSGTAGNAASGISKARTIAACIARVRSRLSIKQEDLAEKLDELEASVAGGQVDPHQILRDLEELPYPVEEAEVEAVGKKIEIVQTLPPPPPAPAAHVARQLLPKSREKPGLDHEHLLTAVTCLRSVTAELEKAEKRIQWHRGIGNLSSLIRWSRETVGKVMESMHTKANAWHKVKGWHKIRLVHRLGKLGGGGGIAEVLTKGDINGWKRHRSSNKNKESVSSPGKHPSIVTRSPRAKSKAIDGVKAQSTLSSPGAPSEQLVAGERKSSQGLSMSHALTLPAEAEARKGKPGKSPRRISPAKGKASSISEPLGGGSVHVDGFTDVSPPMSARPSHVLWSLHSPGASKDAILDWVPAPSLTIDKAQFKSVGVQVETSESPQLPQLDATGMSEEELLAMQRRLEADIRAAADRALEEEKKAMEKIEDELRKVQEKLSKTQANKERLQTRIEELERLLKSTSKGRELLAELELSGVVLSDFKVQGVFGRLYADAVFRMGRLRDAHSTLVGSVSEAAAGSAMKMVTAGGTRDSLTHDIIARGRGHVAAPGPLAELRTPFIDPAESTLPLVIGSGVHKALPAQVPPLDVALAAGAVGGGSEPSTLTRTSSTRTNAKSLSQLSPQSRSSGREHESSVDVMCSVEVVAERIPLAVAAVPRQQEVALSTITFKEPPARVLYETDGGRKSSLRVANVHSGMHSSADADSKRRVERWPSDPILKVQPIQPSLTIMSAMPGTVPRPPPPGAASGQARGAVVRGVMSVQKDGGHACRASLSLGSLRLPSMESAMR